MQIDKFSRHVDCHKLTEAFSVIDEPGHDPVEQICADVHLSACLDYRLARFDRPDFTDRPFQKRAFGRRKFDTTPVSEKAVHEHKMLGIQKGC